MLAGQDRDYIPHAFPSALQLYVAYAALLSSALLFGSTLMSKIIAKDEPLARRPRRKHARCNLSFLFVDRHVHCVAAADNFEPAISCSGDVLGEGVVTFFDFLDLRVGGCVNVLRRDAAVGELVGELVGDLLFGKGDGFGGELVEDAKDG